MRWFQHVADGMTVTEVAQTYGVSQPGVSRALARLEDDLGTPLLQRTGRVLRLTHAGAEFKAHVDQVIAQFDDGVAAVAQLLDPGSGVVTLGYPLSLGAWLVPALLRDFGLVRPGVRVRLQRTSVGDPGMISRLLATGAVELELTTERVSGPGVRWHRMQIEPLLLAVPATHRLAGQQEADLADVADEPFVLRRAPSGMRNQVLQLCRRAGFDPEIRFEVDDLPTVRGLVAVGLGVGVVPALGLDTTLGLAATPGQDAGPGLAAAPGPDAAGSAGGMALLRLRDPQAHREIGLAWHTDRRLLPSAKDFRRFALTGSLGD